jgi:hypothetical protein
MCCEKIMISKLGMKYLEQKFVDTKGVIRSHKSKNRKYNDHKKKD